MCVLNICKVIVFVAVLLLVYLFIKAILIQSKIGGKVGGKIIKGGTLGGQFPKFLGYWKDTKSFCIGKKEDTSHINHCVPVSDKSIKGQLGSSFSKSLGHALNQGHKYMALKRGISDKDSELLTFNQLAYGSKVEYNYHLPSFDHHDKQAGCSRDVCKKKFDLDNELWAVYQLYH